MLLSLAGRLRLAVQSSVKLGWIVACFAVAWFAVEAIKVPGRYITDRWSGSELEFPVPASAPLKLQLLAGYSGLRSVACEQYVAGWPEAYVQRLLSARPGAELQVCRFRFDMPQAEVFAKWPNPKELLNAALGDQAPPAERVGWKSRSIFLGSELAWRVLPDAIQLLMALCVAWAIGLRPGSELARLRTAFSPDNAARTGYAWCVVVGYTVSWGLANKLTGGSEWTVAAYVGSAAAGPPGFLANAISATLMAPITEEILFRAWMIPFLSRVMNPHAAILLSAALFSYAHGYDNLYYDVYFLFNGILFGYLWLQSRSLLVCIGAHALLNFGPSVVRPLALQLAAAWPSV